MELSVIYAWEISAAGLPGSMSTSCIVLQIKENGKASDSPRGGRLQQHVHSCDGHSVCFNHDNSSTYSPIQSCSKLISSIFSRVGFDSLHKRMELRSPKRLIESQARPRCSEVVCFHHKEFSELVCFLKSVSLFVFLAAFYSLRACMP